MNKTAIKNFAILARRKLISDITFKAGMLGITEEGIAEPLTQSTNDLQFFDIGTKEIAQVSGDQIRQRNALIQAIREKEKTSDYKTAFRTVVEEVAYTWFNRLIAIRFMEVNDYIPSHVRVLSSENPDKLEPDIVTNPFETDLEFTPYEKDLVLQMKEENRLDELFRMLFIKQCYKLGEILPELFEKTSDYTELLLTISFTDKDGVVSHLTHDISEDDFNVEKEGQVEIIGWLYQYYNTEPKDEVFKLLKKNVKVTKERIPAATQLFTPDWIVRYMVENSLGRLWVEGHPNENLKENWKYYLEGAKQEDNVQKQLEEIRKEYAELKPEDIKCIDPCMGSGHILVYMFDVLMQIYETQGYTQRDAAKSILINNLYGIDIDKRAYQLAYFAVMMKARQYSRRILQENILPNLMYVQGSPKISRTILRRLDKYENLGNKLLDEFKYAEEYGSILNVSFTRDGLEGLEKKIIELAKDAPNHNLIVQMEVKELSDTIKPLIREAKIMGQGYEIVVTNPPYKATSDCCSKIVEYITDNYPDSKADLYSVFIEKCGHMVKRNGLQAMITMQGWMFNQSFKKLRSYVLDNFGIVNMVHLGMRAFSAGDVGTIVKSTCFVLVKKKVSILAQYINAVNKQNSEEKDNLVQLAAKKQLSQPYIYLAYPELYSLIPNSPLAYWTNEHIAKLFVENPISQLGSIRTGLQTGDNERFLRLWHEVSVKEISFNSDSLKSYLLQDVKWIPQVKGGEFRRWYGNFDYILNWKGDGFEIRKCKSSRLNAMLDGNNGFGEGVSWSHTSDRFGVRYLPRSIMFNVEAPSFIPENKEHLMYILGFLNSIVALYCMKLMDANVHFLAGNVKLIPCLLAEYDSVSARVCENVDICKYDWNSFETSWDFKSHPLLFGLTTISKAYEKWKDVCDSRFNRLKSNEEELNRIFISMYGLQNELTPEVEDKDVTVRKANLQRDIKSLISYAVGCMFGRYSLDIDGLVYAGGEWDSSKYKTFIPDEDNCIPITDEEYFEDDIVGRFVEFIKDAYGADMLEENLDFIASALGKKGDTSRRIIRNYFLEDFFKEHCQNYSVTGSGKRPIYWQFDSGDLNGFKALVYMHRWNADTVGNVRVEYLHRMQQIYEREIENCQDIIDNSSDNKEIAKAVKRKEKLLKQQKECRDYDAKIAHIALSRIDIDLDDGVKKNYRKVQTGADGKFCEILSDSKTIMAKDEE